MTFKNHNFKNGDTCEYCQKTHFNLIDEKGMLGECLIGKDKNDQLDEEAILLTKAIRILRDDL